MYCGGGVNNLLSSAGFCSEDFQPGLNLSTQTEWNLTNKEYKFGVKIFSEEDIVSNEPSVAIKLIPETPSADPIVLNLSDGEAVFTTEKDTTGIGIFEQNSNLKINGNIKFTGSGYDTMAVIMAMQSHLTISGTLDVEASSQTSPVIPLRLEESNVSIDKIYIKSGGSLAEGGVPGLPHSGATFIMAHRGSLKSEDVFFEVKEDNRGPIYGLNVEETKVEFSNFRTNIDNKTGDVIVVSMAYSKVNLGSGEIIASSPNDTVIGIGGSGGLLAMNGGSIILNSNGDSGFAKGIEVGAAQLDNLTVIVKAPEGIAQGMYFVDDTTLNNINVRVEGKSGYIYGVETAGYDGKGYTTITGLTASVTATEGDANGVLINRGAKISSLKVDVSPGENKVGIGLQAGGTKVDLDTVSISVTGTKGYGIVASSPEVNLTGTNSVTASESLASSPNYDENKADSYKKFAVNILDGESTFIGKINKFQGTFNAVGGTTVFSDTTLNGDFNVGNAIVVFGDENSDKINAIKKENELQTPLLYAAKPVTLLKGSHLTVGGDSKPILGITGVVIDKGATVVFNNSEDSYAFNSDVEDATFTVKEGAVLFADNLVAGQDVKIAKFATPITIEEGSEIKPLSRLFDLKLKKDPLTGEFVMEVTASPSIEPDVPDVPSVRNLTTLIPNSVLATAYGTQGTGAERILALSDVTNGLTDKQFVDAVNKIALMGTAGAAQNISINTASLIGESLTRHGSVLAASSHEKIGADLWIDINGSFSKATSLAAGSESYGYKSDMSLITIGSDYAFGNGLAAGAAVNFGKGSVRGQGAGSGTKNKVDFWGVNAYGVWSTDYANVVGTVGYLESSNEITQSGYKGKPKVKAFSTEIRVEKPIAVSDAFKVTPHVGLRYLHLDMDSFSAGGFKYGSEKANLGQIPVGVAFNGNFKAPCGADVVPFVDLEVAPAFGNRKVKHTVALENSSIADSFNTRITGNALYTGRIGLSVAKGNHSLGLSYGLSGGNDGRVDQNLKARYRYQF